MTPYLATLINLNDDLFFQAFASYRLQTDDFAAAAVLIDNFSGNRIISISMPNSVTGCTAIRVVRD